MTVPAAPADGRLHPGAVRVTVVGSRGELDMSPVVVEPPAVPVAGAPGEQDSGGAVALAHVDEGVVSVAVTWLDPVRAAVERVGGEDVHPDDRGRTRVLVLDSDGTGAAPQEREVVVDGWSIRVSVEPERRAALRERASRGRTDAAAAGPTDVRAVIPGRVLNVSVGPGDHVGAGQQLLVVEAMKMQNELRAPRAGRVRSVEAVPGRTIEVGELLVVLE